MNVITADSIQAIESLATEFNMEPYAVTAALDLDGGDSITEDEAREVLTLMSEQAAE